MSGLKFVRALVLCMLVVSPIATTAITCGQVTSQVTGCLNYLQKGGALPPACCAGIRNLNSLARTTPDHQTACRCLQSAAKRMPNIKANLASGLPGKCGVNIPYKISTSINCNSVK